MKKKDNQNLEYLAHVFNSIPDEIIVMDNDMKIREANRSFLQNNELEMDDVLGMKCCDLEQHIRADCDDLKDNCPFQAATKKKHPVYTIRKHTDEDGVTKYAMIVAAPVVDDKGDTLGLIEMTQDVTRRKMLERQLAATEGRLQRYLEAAPFATYAKDDLGYYIDVNKAMTILLGLEKEQIINKIDSELFSKENARLLAQGDKEMFENKRDVAFDVVLDLKGRRVYLSINKFPIFNINNEVVAVCGIANDMTAQRMAEREVRSTTEYLQNILDNSAVIVITADVEGQVVTFNREAERLLGYTMEDATNMHTSGFFRDHEERAALMRRLKKEGTIVDHSTHLVKKDGTLLPVSVTLSKLRDAKGRSMGTTAVGKDISYRKSLMDQIMLSERQAAVGRLAAGVAHEINNPLALIGEIAGYLNDLVTGGPGSESADMLEELQDGLPKILKQIKRGRSITSRLLSFARKTEVEISVADVSAALDEILPFLEKEGRMAKIVIHQDLEVELPSVAIEELQLQEIVMNLIKNAIQAIRENKGANIWLTTRKTGKKVSIVVRDDGPGIDQSVRDRIFDPFVTTKPPGQGTGLGLSICYGIVKRFDGEIRVDSEMGKGSRFEVIFPIALETD